MEAVGTETYMNLLKEAINELKGEDAPAPVDLEIQTPFNCFIPSSYMTEPRERLKTYKRLSNMQDQNSLLALREELQDRFGHIPNELDQLLTLLSVRLILGPLGVEKLRVAGKNVELAFSQKYLNKQKERLDQTLNFFFGPPKAIPIWSRLYSNKSFFLGYFP